MVEKYFNTEGLCDPTFHYMVDTSKKIDTIIRDYVDRGRYFVINRARQYGKTTTLDLLAIAIQDRYLVIPLTFEGKEGYFESRESLVNGVCAQIATNQFCRGGFHIRPRSPQAAAGRQNIHTQRNRNPRNNHRL